MDPKNILLIGKGGREDALAQHITKSRFCHRVYSAPGNPGMAEVSECIPELVTATNMAQAAKEHLKIDFAIIGPEDPLKAGLSDQLRKVGIPTFGPSRKAAKIEWSKEDAKRFFRKHDLPTARYKMVHSLQGAQKVAGGMGYPFVMKSNVLASGKGVRRIFTKRQFEHACEEYFVQKIHGPVTEILIEEFLHGNEVSITLIVSDEVVLRLADCVDHKTLRRNGREYMTGGMGTYSSPRILSRGVSNECQIISQKIAQGLCEENRPLRGVLYWSAMVTREGPKIIETNTRFGDPECQALMVRLRSDLVPIMYAAATGELTRHRFHIAYGDPSVCIALASYPYPDSPRTGDIIRGLDAVRRISGITVYHAGTALHNQCLVSVGGRVLNICAQGSTVHEAAQKAYAAARLIVWRNKRMIKNVGMNIR